MSLKELREETRLPKSGYVRILVVAVIIAALTVSAYLPVKLLIIGSKRCDDIEITEAYITDNEVFVSGRSKNRGEHFSKADVEVRDGGVYISAVYVLGSGKSDFTVKNEGNFKETENIYLSGDDKDRLIYKRQKAN